ncbi:MAG: addiction module protein [Betaproteobacteria bacterium]|nr:addiction module protein [Betaproteobacteria bacterium]
MPSNAEVLHAEALQLPAAGRARLAERLITGLDVAPEVEEAWVAEVERRNAGLKSAPSHRSLVPKPWPS